MSAWTVISHVEVPSGGASNITFLNVGNIPSTYTDLMVKISLRSNRATFDDQIIIKPNNSSSNLTYRNLRGNGSTATSDTNNRTYVPGTDYTANTFGNGEIYIPNYAGNTNKSFYVDTVTEQNATESYQSIQAVLWSQTDAITSLVIAPVSGTQFLQYSSATLYGITKGSSGGVTVS